MGLFKGIIERGCGVLLHPTCLPSTQGIGSLGEQAYAFIDFLEKAGFGYWQICPLCPTSYGDSPYQGLSAFAGNPYLIDLQTLVNDDLLAQNDLLPLNQLSTKRVEYGYLWEHFWPVLEKAYKVFSTASNHPYRTPYETFKREQSQWLDDYAAFVAIKQSNGLRCWQDWPVQLRDYAKSKKSWTKFDDSMEKQKFYQFLFFHQWEKLHAYAKRKNIKIIGDIPIFVSLDSADVWANPKLFSLDKDLHPKCVAGVPPDYFSEDGQLWGNPLFDWQTHRIQKYAWWIDRLSSSFKLYDMVRIDHFRGFESYWSIPAESKTAKTGKWEKGPGMAFFEAIKNVFPEAPIILEDLGIATPEVNALKEATGLPGMAVLQFAFGDPDSAYLPHNLDKNSVLYPGTHDNDTSTGWYQSLPESARDHFRRYLRVNGHEVSWDLIRTGYASTSKLFIVAMQDLLSLGSDARMNTPGKPSGNWQWRFSNEQLLKLNRESSAYLRQLKDLYIR